MADEETAISEVVITGSRIVRDGFQAPTPVTTLTGDALQSKAPSNIPDALNQLPQFRGSTSQTQGNTFNPVSPNQGNYLNLRNLGTQRSLILLDGLRVPPTSFAGGVDINTLPQMLVERVEVVTGGASAAYGSDAVVGVVNFILDKRFEGVKTVVQGGTSIYGDANSYKLGIAAGKSLLDGRAHVEFSAEHYRQEGLKIDDRPRADELWIFTGGGTAANPFVPVSNARYRTMTFGGLIFAGPANLVGQRFQPGGTLVTANMGQATASSNVSIGGDGAIFSTPNGPQPSLTGGLRTDQLFGRASFEVTPNLEVYGQLSFGESRNTYTSTADNRQANSANTLTIFSGNAFLRPEVQALLGANPSFVLARQNAEFPNFQQDVLNTSINATVGVMGKFADKWNWDLSYVHGETRLRSHGVETYNPRFYAAADAVRDPAGNIVCRVTLTNPGLYPGCVPINLFGEGAPSSAAVAYVFGDTQYQVVNKMDIFAFNMSGDLFDLWAGPLSVAFGGEYRKQSLDETSNADPAIPWDRTGLRGVPSNAVRFRGTNVGVASGEVNVKEAYVEAVLPLLKDLPFAKSLDINGAFRYTDYSTSGTAYTWKAGMSYQPIDDLRIRATVSRDIAAPSLYQLFQGQQVATNLQLDPHTGITGQWIEVTSGNNILKPEVGAMTVAGAVYTPSWAPGLKFSVDYYGVLITNAIGTTSGPQELIDCEVSGGVAPVCDLIIRPRPFSDRTAANFPTQVLLQPQNLAKLYQAGFDIEVAYTTPVDRLFSGMEGNLDFRLLISVLDTYKIKQGRQTATQEFAGAGLSRVSGDPGGENAKLRGSFEVGYTNGPLSVRLTERATGKSKLSFVQVYADLGENPNRFYTDIDVSYKFGSEMQTEGFVNVRNLFNQKPPLVPGMGNVGVYPTNKVIYDVVGTYFTVGVRHRW